MRSHRALSLVLALGGALSACGGGTSAAPEASSQASSSDEHGTAGGETRHRQSARELIGIHGPERPWSEMGHEDREMDMIGRFLPITSEMFREHDADEYASFGCETCHGPDMQERHFHMPSAHLPPVPPAGTPAYQQMAAAHPEETRFMEEHVTPAMQTMLGMGATFTCNGCHPTSATASVEARF
jgi:hypothetical protein